jgi:hypothetical protein
MKLFVYALGGLGILFIVTAVLMQVASSNFKPVIPAPESACPQAAGTLPGGFKGRVIAIEFARSVCDVEVIIGAETHENRAVMRRVLKLDTFFILSYWLLFAVLGFLLTQGGSRWAMWLGLIAIICGTGSAFFDFIENSGIRHVVDTPLSATTSEMVVAIRDATLVKWCLSFVTSMLLAAALLYLDADGASAPRLLGILSGISFVAGALVGLIGLHYNKLIPLTVLLQFPGLIGLIILSFFWPQAFLWKL